MRVDANRIQPAQFGPIPDGTYRVRVEQAEEIENKQRTGCYLELVLVVADGAFKGRKLWARYTSAHENVKAQEIGLGQISAALRALGRPVIDHERELVGAVGDCVVGRDRSDSERNEVKRWILPDEQKGAPTYSTQHQRAAAERHDIHGERSGPTYGGSAQSTRRPEPPPEPARSADRFDDDIPF